MQEGVWYGVVRNGRARFGLSGGDGDDLTEVPDLIVETISPEGRRSKNSVLLKRLNPEVWAADDSEGELNNIRLWYEPDCTLESLGMITSMKLTLNGRELSQKRNYSLGNTLPLREKECQDYLWFASSKNRFHDKPTLKWVANQVFRSDLAE